MTDLQLLSIGTAAVAVFALFIWGIFDTGKRGEIQRDAKALDLTPLAENPETEPWRRK